jgi:cell division protein FtsN
VTSRDYRRNTGRRGRSSTAGFSGWTGLAIGLVIGLALAGGVWQYKSRPPTEPVAAKSKKPAPQSARDESAEQDTGTGTEFTFADRLKNFEVVIPEKDKDVHRDLRPVPETRPGTYVLQAGSYRAFTDADRVRAQLALAGVESKVQKVTVDADTWHRVRVGPISNLDELNRIRTRLRRADIDALVIRIGD